tara:strand:+ start:1421 stop:2725 length:1305 start_codon:yes stop_codon:yes gene_type:complete
MIDFIQESIKELKLHNAKKREDHIEKLLDYYNGNDTKNYISRMFSSAVFNEIPLVETNITRKLINKMSRIYTIGANRNVNDKYDELTVFKSARMKHVERMTRLVGTIATRVVWNEGGESPYFDYRPIYFFHVFFDNDPFVPSAITYPILQAVRDISKVGKMEYAYWDAEKYVHMDEDGAILNEIPHSYGVLPFVFTHRENQTDDFYVEGANDIINANEHVNIAMTEMQLGLRFQMFGQPVMTGAEMGNNQRTGSDVTLELPEGSSYQIVAPQGNVEGVIENIKFLVELVAQNNHLWVQWSEQGGEVPSGISLMIKDLERTEDYQDDLALWRMYEEDFYRVERQIASSLGVSLPKELGLDFKEPEYPKTVQDQILWDKHRLELNLIGEVELLMEYNNDLTQEQAELIIASNKQRNQKLSIFEQARQATQRTASIS